MYQKQFLYRKKIIGGSLIGDVWNTTKDVIRQGAKMAWDKGKELLNIGANQAKEYAKNKISDLAVQGAEKLVSKVNEGAKTVSNKLSPQMRETIKTITNNPKVRKVLQDKTKQILSKAPITDSSRAILSNIIAGSGVKRIK